MIVKSYSNAIDLVTNLLTIAVALLFIGLVAQRFVFSESSTTLAPVPGSTIAVNGFEPTGNQKNVALVLIKGCRFCEASMEFYRELNEQRRTRNFGIVAIFPSGTKEAEAYLQTFSLRVPITYSPLSELNVEATPTIIVTDDQGKVLKSWVGELDEARQREVRGFLGS